MSEYEVYFDLNLVGVYQENHILIADFENSRIWHSKDDKGSDFVIRTDADIIKNAWKSNEFIMKFYE